MRDASFHLLDRAAWPRSEHFDYYIRTVKCRYDLTAHLTVTALRERGKALGLRFYPLLLYIAARGHQREPGIPHGLQRARRARLLGFHQSVLYDLP